jgi:WD40 repeat protein
MDELISTKIFTIECDIDLRVESLINEIDFNRSKSTSLVNNFHFTSINFGKLGFFSGRHYQNVIFSSVLENTEYSDVVELKNGNIAEAELYSVPLTFATNFDIKIWSINPIGPNTHIGTLSGHSEELCDMFVAIHGDDKLISFSNTEAIVWNTKTFSCLVKFNFMAPLSEDKLPHMWLRKCVEIDEDRLLCIYEYTYTDFENGYNKNGVYFNIWSCKTKNIILSIDKVIPPELGRGYPLCIIKLKNGYIMNVDFSGNKSLEIWNVDSGEILSNSYCHTDTIIKILEIENNIILSGSDDRSLKIWKLSTDYTSLVLLKTIFKCFEHNSTFNPRLPTIIRSIQNGTKIFIYSPYENRCAIYTLDGFMKFSMKKIEIVDLFETKNNSLILIIGKISNYRYYTSYHGNRTLNVLDLEEMEISGVGGSPQQYCESILATKSGYILIKEFRKNYLIYGGD